MSKGHPVCRKPFPSGKGNGCWAPLPNSLGISCLKFHIYLFKFFYKWSPKMKVELVHIIFYHICYQSCSIAGVWSASWICASKIYFKFLKMQSVEDYFPPNKPSRCWHFLKWCWCSFSLAIWVHDIRKFLVIVSPQGTFWEPFRYFWKHEAQMRWQFIKAFLNAQCKTWSPYRHWDRSVKTNSTIKYNIVLNWGFWKNLHIERKQRSSSVLIDSLFIKFIT